MIRKRSALHASQEVEAPVFLFLAGTLISWALGVCLCGKNCSDMVKFWNDGVFEMPFEKVYQCLVQKAERKGRTQEEVDQVIKWLTGYVSMDILNGLTYGQFLSLAPMWNPRSELITGSICGIKVEEIDDPLTKKMRQLDKLIDELATGKPMEKVLR